MTNHTICAFCKYVIAMTDVHFVLCLCACAKAWELLWVWKGHECCWFWGSTCWPKDIAASQLKHWMPLSKPSMVERCNIIIFVSVAFLMPMTSSDPLSDHLLVQWAVGSFWCMSPWCLGCCGWSESAVPGWWKYWCSWLALTGITYSSSSCSYLFVIVEQS